jgi:hypothetical protein
VTVELLYFDGRPNHDAPLPHIERLLRVADEWILDALGRTAT